MSNKYLEKIAFTEVIGGYLGADNGDKVGGTVVGMLGGWALASRVNNPTAQYALAGLGGYAGGKLYSYLKHPGKNPFKKSKE